MLNVPSSKMTWWVRPLNWGPLVAPGQRRSQTRSAQGVTAAIARIPVGTVTPDGAEDPADLFLTYRNFGDVDLTGFDVAVSWFALHDWTVGANYSYASKDFFEDASGVSDIALNAPKHKVGANVQWHELVERAQRGGGIGRFARWRDRIVCTLAESIAEQRTLWALRNETAATVRIPGSLSGDDAERLMRAEFGRARNHHLRWLGVDLVLLRELGDKLAERPPAALA